jgi:group I intron endonuclease
MAVDISGIYSISYKDGRQYIGSAVSIRARWGHHRYRLRNGEHHSSYLQRVWSKYGESEFTFTVLECCLPEELIIREQWWIDNLKPEFNILQKAGSWLGQKHTEESKRKIAERAKISQLGRKHSEESKLKRSIALKGRKPSPQTIAATIKACKGRKLTPEHRAKIAIASRNISEETREKLRISSTGRKHSEETRAKITQANLRRWEKYRKEN